MDVAEFADLTLSHLEHLFGAKVFNALVDEIEEDYFGEMDVRTAIIERPDLFERAFMSILGKVGMEILENICNDICREHRLDTCPIPKYKTLPHTLKQ